MWAQVEEEKNLTEEMVIRQGMNVPNRKVCQDVLLECTRKAAVPNTGKTTELRGLPRLSLSRAFARFRTEPSLRGPRRRC